MAQRFIPLTIATTVMLATPALAQLNTQHVKGTYGLKSGAQPPPGGYVVPLVYVYGSDTVRNRDGDRIGPSVDLTASFFGVGYLHVTPKKLLGGYYAFNVLVAGANNRIQGTEIDANPGAGITDGVVAPLMLGWHFKKADVMSAYSIFVPIGRYTDGASDNTGLGMWGHELMTSVTGYLTPDRKYHASTAVSFDMQSKKEDSDTKVGNQINFEGGIGGDFSRRRLSLGLLYYASFKVSDDRIDGLPGVLVRGRNKTFAIGPEVTWTLERKGVIYGAITGRYFVETYARTTTQGNAFLLQASFFTRPLHLPTK